MKRMILAPETAGLSVAVSASPPSGDVGPPAHGTPAQAPGRSDAALASFQNVLEQDGFEVYRGDTVAHSSHRQVLAPMKRTFLDLPAVGLSSLMLAGIAAIAAPNGTQPTAVPPGQRVISQAAVPKAGTGNFEQQLIRELRSKDMEVSVGYPRVYTQADCAHSYPVFKNCFGNNPASPYVMPVVKSWPDEYVDPAMKNGFGRTRPGYSVTYRLDPREAIVLFGRMPQLGNGAGASTIEWDQHKQWPKAD